MDSKKRINKNQIAKNFDPLTVERIAKIFSDKGLTNTSKWITHAIETKLPDPERYFPSGVMGDPTIASAKKGKKINDYVIEQIVKLVEELKK